MKKGSCLTLALVAISLLAASLAPFNSSKSPNSCVDCHQNYTMHLDILEGDAGNTLPTALKDGETLTVAVVLKVTSNSPAYKTMSTITVTLASQNGFFSVASPTFSVGSLTKGQTARASWMISPLAPGTDLMLITAQGVNQHGPTYYTDSYSPQPSMVVDKQAVDMIPSIDILAPEPARRFSGGAEIPVLWAVNDDNRSSCKVDLYYSTDDFIAENRTIAAGLPAGQGYTWNAPSIDSSSVRLKATVTDKNGKFNETLQDGGFTIDSTPPSVLSVLPAERERDVTGFAIIQVRFSEPVVQIIAQGAFRISPDPGGIAWDWSSDNTSMTAAHNSFRANTTYTCSIISGVKDLSTPGNAGQGAFSWSFSTPEILVNVPSMILSSPAGGERFYWGDKTTISWTASGGNGNLTLNLSISENGTSGPFFPIADEISNRGQHNFTISEFLSDACIVEAVVHDQNGMEARSRSAIFSIAQNISIVAGFPPARIPLHFGNSTSVNWTTTGGHGAVNVSLSLMQAVNSTANAIRSNLPRSGRLDWTIPDIDATSARLILNATDGWGRHLEFYSDPLTIVSSNPPRPVQTNHLPVVLFNLREAQLITGRPATFDASGSFDPDGDSLHYIWDFGDGTGTTNTTNTTISHVFPDGGNYTLVLTVGDNRNESSQAMLVRVEARPAAPNPNPAEWPIIAFGMLVILAGSVGVGYALATRPATRTGMKAAHPLDGAGALLIFDIEKCTGCGVCSKRCPSNAIRMASRPPDGPENQKKPRNRPRLDDAGCTGCEECLKHCVHGAIAPGPMFERMFGG